MACGTGKTRVASHVRRSYHRREAAEQRLSVNPHEATPDPEQLTQRLEARVRRAFDPAGVFETGRFLDAADAD